MFNDTRSALCFLAIGSVVFGILLAFELWAHHVGADQLTLTPY